MKYNSFSFVIHTTTLRVLKKYAPNLLSIIVILVVVMAAFSVLTGATFTAKWDMMNQFLPCRYFISECLHHHIFPLWCPYINFGYPFYADPQSGLFYPVTWLIALTTGYTVYTIGLEYVMHVCIAGIAFYYLLKSFELDNYTAIVFGIIYCMSGVFISNAQHLPWIVTMAWMPLIMLNFKNISTGPNWKNALGLGLFLYLAITGGYPGFFIILFYFFMLYSVVSIGGLVKSKGPSVAIPVVLFFALAAVIFLLLTGGYLYSFIHSLPYIARGKPVTLQEANNIAVTPRAMISLMFPFATACSSFKLNTDISMANIYCGFLLLPLLFIALVKARLAYFHKAIFAFAVVALLAAAGNYFYVRTWLYNFVPGMNMLRHAAIFRVFTVFGFVFMAATGFGWLINAMRTKTNDRFIKIIFASYFLFLFVIFLMAGFKNGYHIGLLSFFNTADVAEFNAKQNVYGHITAQLFFQLCLLLVFMGALFLRTTQSNTRIVLLSAVTIAEIFISVQLNLPATVVSDVTPAELQGKLNMLSTGFPVPPLNPMGSFTHYSDGSTLPVWYNISFFKKIPAKDGFNSFYLQSVDDLGNSSRQNFFMHLPVVFFKNADTKFELKKFEPNDVAVGCQSTATDTIHLQQNFYKGWKVFVDNKEEVPGHELCSMSAAIPAGNHTVRFEYRQMQVQYLFLLSVISAMLITGLLLGNKLKEVFNS